MDYWCVDRIEEGLAVLEGPDQSFSRIDLSLLPAQVKEGDCLVQSGGQWQIDKEETCRRRQEAVQRFRAVFEKYRSGLPDEKS